MEILVGPIYDTEVSSSPSPSTSCVRDSNSGVRHAPAQPQDKLVSSSYLFLKDDEGGGDRKTREKCGSSYRSDDCSNSSSSVGAPGDSEDENDEVSSYKGEEFQLSMDLFRDSLPIKRGLSNHYSGKSKSFGNVSEVNAVKDLEKEENSFNKRRRVLIASKLWGSRKSFYSQHSPKSMPLLPVLPDDDKEEEEEEEEED